MISYKEQKGGSWVIKMFICVPLGGGGSCFFWTLLVFRTLLGQCFFLPEGSLCFIIFSFSLLSDHFVQIPLEPRLVPCTCGGADGTWHSVSSVRLMSVLLSAVICMFLEAQSYTTSGHFTTANSITAAWARPSTPEQESIAGISSCASRQYQASKLSSFLGTLKQKHDFFSLVFCPLLL